MPLACLESSRLKKNSVLKSRAKEVGKDVANHMTVGCEGLTSVSLWGLIWQGVRLGRYIHVHHCSQFLGEEIRVQRMLKPTPSLSKSGLHTFSMCIITEACELQRILQGQEAGILSHHYICSCITSLNPLTFGLVPWWLLAAMQTVPCFRSFWSRSHGDREGREE